MAVADSDGPQEIKAEAFTPFSFPFWFCLRTGILLSVGEEEKELEKALSW